MGSTSPFSADMIDGGDGPPSVFSSRLVDMMMGECGGEILVSSSAKKVRRCHSCGERTAVSN
jgi:ribosomal protein S27E